MTARLQKVRKGDAYLELVRQSPLRPIRSDAELDRAVEVIDALIDQDRLEPGAKDYLDVLSDQVERYETMHHPIMPLSDGAILQHLIQTRG